MYPNDQYDWMAAFQSDPFGRKRPLNEGGFFAPPQVRGSGLFSDAPEQRDARMALAAALLEGSGPSLQPTSGGQILGRALMASRAARDAAIAQSKQRELQEAQIRNLDEANSGLARDYEYAKQQGFPGTIEEWATLKARAGGGAEPPASLQEYEIVKQQAIAAGKTPPTLEQWLRDKAAMTPINPSVQVVGGVPSVVQPKRGGAPSVSPLSTPQQELDAAADKAGATAGGAKEAERLQTQIDTGLDAADALATVNRGIELLDGVETGGLVAEKPLATNLFGITGADEAELSANLGKAVLSQLRATFGAQFTEKEGARLAEIEAGFGKSTEGNKRLLQQAQKILERAARRGIRAAERAGDTETAREIRDAMQFTLSPQSAQKPSAPAVGTVEDGYRFKGGDPSKRENWEKAE